ncbi:type VII secretion target [Miniimonas sp. S16]|uniref:type VII secretion target n=1 Tax=Miniimonas sp. S16 TaxID=2171623 RepID=UPI00131F0133|nr:type VII secretion target [Miniimonas sp. S16]
MSEAFEVDTAALREHAEHWGVIADEIASVGEAIQGLSPLAWGLGAITDPGVSFHEAWTGGLSLVGTAADDTGSALVASAQDYEDTDADTAARLEFEVP